jgi:hypothetical protein
VLSSVKEITPEKIVKSIVVILSVIILYVFFIFLCIWGKSRDLKQEQEKKVKNLIIISISFSNICIISGPFC